MGQTLASNPEAGGENRGRTEREIRKGGVEGGYASLFGVKIVVDYQEPAYIYS